MGILQQQLQDPCDWTQHGHDSTHGGNACHPGQPLNRKLASFTFDPFVDQEVAAAGELLTHYQVPLLVGDDLYMLVKTGTYVDCDPKGAVQPCGLDAWGSQVWNEAHFVWQDGQLTEDWRFESDWKPEPASFANWEPVFQPAIDHEFLYVPGAGGTVHKLDRKTGREVARINPFGGKLDPDIYVAGGLAAAASGHIYYNAIRLDPSDPFSDATGWLVRISPDGEAKAVTYDTLVPDAPLPTDLCGNVFGASGVQQWLPKGAAIGQLGLPESPCLSQRPGLNITPAIGWDGTVYTASRAHGSMSYAYVVAVTPDLEPKWDTSLRNILSADDWTLDPTVLRGGHPAANILDISTSAPVVLPDRSVLFGAYTFYNEMRGHLFHFSADGTPLNTYDFGWDVTPAYFSHGSSWSILLKDNHYDSQRYVLSSLAPDLTPEWSFQSGNTQTCQVGKDGQLTCVDDHPNGFEWCVNAPAVDSEGTVYANSEDGFLYAVGRDGTEKGHIFLNHALGAAYTPVSLDSKGRIYALNGGVLTVIGQ